MKFRCIYLVLLLLVSMSGFSDLVPMTDVALSESTGQSLVLIEESSHTQTNGDVYDFNRITLGLEIEINATIDELSLGTYYRADGQDCSANGYFCDNTTDTTYNTWNCSVSECGGITADADGYNTLSVSPLIYGDLFDHAGISYNSFSVGTGAIGLGDGAYAENVEYDSTDGLTLFPSGFNYTQDTDLVIRDMTLGLITDNGDGTQTIEDFVFEDPYFEFAYNTTGEIVGLRTGFGSADGVQGNAIDVFSGFVKPVVTVTADVEVVFTGSGTFTFAPYLGGVRTPGYIDPDDTKSELVGGCSESGTLGGTVCDSVDTIEEVAEASPQSQLFPLQALVLDESPTFWLSIQSEDVDYPDQVVMRENSDGVMEEVTYGYETAKSGVWFNLGALEVYADGTSIDILDIADYTGFAVSTDEPLHPDNYFSANTTSAKYPQVNNDYYY
jgi:hypothetical protein